MRFVGVCLLAAVFLIPASYAHLPVHSGRWGGFDIEITIKPRFTRVELNCAHGIIMDWLLPDRQGEFNIAGILVLEGPGPIQPPGDSHPAHFVGDVDHKTMHLTIILDDTGETLGPFILTRGDRGIIVKCF